LLLITNQVSICRWHDLTGDPPSEMRFWTASSIALTASN